MSRLTEIEERQERLKDYAAWGGDHSTYAQARADIEYLLGVAKAGMALYERVEMDESVGTCLSSRVESLNFAAALHPDPGEESP